jgi:hypothetical protein
LAGSATGYFFMVPDVGSHSNVPGEAAPGEPMMTTRSIDAA